MATTTPQLDRASARDRVLEVVRVLLEELGSQGVLPSLSATSHLDRDLGLGSLERVELLARLETEFNVRLPDQLAAEANTPDDLARALMDAPGGDVAEADSSSALRASVTAQKLQREATEAGVFSAKHCSTCCAIGRSTMPNARIF